jgi:Glycosyltransferase family 10 (fucosyltransferase) C-term/Alpha-(1,3)-fucosyltransferase FucT N-terminal domain
MKELKLSAIGQYATYKEESLLPIVLSSLGYRITWVDPNQCDVLIIGKPMSALKLILKKGGFLLLPNQYHALINKMLNNRHYRPVTLFHTCENLRHDSVKTDYSVSFDFSEENDRHYRLPYWMELVDWSHEGLVGNKNKRFGKLLSMSRMLQPLGSNFLSKPRKAALFASHLTEPRKSFYKAINKVVPVDGYGKYFDKNISSHSDSGFDKLTILKRYAFNLCPENKLYPGYYTEKIPEAFLGETLPLTWTDRNVSADFNPDAFINLEQTDWRNADLLHELLHSNKQLAPYAEQPLLLKAPTIEPFRDFLVNIIRDAL